MTGRQRYCYSISLPEYNRAAIKVSHWNVRHCSTPSFFLHTLTIALTEARCYCAHGGRVSFPLCSRANQLQRSVSRPFRSDFDDRGHSLPLKEEATKRLSSENPGVWGVQLVPSTMSRLTTRNCHTYILCLAHSVTATGTTSRPYTTWLADSVTAIATVCPPDSHATREQFALLPLLYPWTGIKGTRQGIPTIE